jgi:RsiW-degrading membrane proteinase PrsW (M82 family)
MESSPAATCTVCGRTLNTRNEYGSRLYCDTHLHRFAEDVRPVWRASATALVFTLLMIVGLVIANQLWPDTGDFAKLLVSAAVSLLPAAIWLLTLFRSTPRLPGGLSNSVVIIFVLSALLAAAISRPLLLEVVNVDDWLGRTTPINRFAGNVLINGFFHAFMLYAVVRYATWNSPTFERRVDGILFELAAGWGYLTMLNLLFVFDQDALSFLNGDLRLIAQMCAFLAPSLILGYVIGRNRFEDFAFYYLSGGLVLAAGVNGLLLYAGSELNTIRLNLAQDGFSPWPGLVISLIILIVIYAVINGLLRRHNALTRARLEYTVE